MNDKVKILPSNVRVDNLDIMEFVSKLPEIVKHAPELEGTRLSSASFYHPKGSISIGWAAERSFTLSAPPEVLNPLLEAIKKFYQAEGK